MTQDATPPWDHVTSTPPPVASSVHRSGVVPYPVPSMGELTIEVERVRELVFADGAPVRAASGVARFAGGWLVVQDDGTHAALVMPDGPVTPLRIFPPVEGLDHFAEHDGTKHLKPDLEAACEVPFSATPAVLVLGSGSTAARRRGAVVTWPDDSGNVIGGPSVTWADLGPLYERATAVLGLEPSQVNFEGLSVGRSGGGTLRWFNRGNGALGVGSASVEIDGRGLLDAIEGRRPAGEVAVGEPLWHELGTVAGVALSVTDAVSLGGGAILVSSAAEDTPNNVDDGPVVGTALSIVAGPELGVVHHGQVPLVSGQVPKIEGLALLQGPAPADLADLADLAGGAARGELRVLAVVDADDALIPSSELVLRVSWGR